MPILVIQANRGSQSKYASVVRVCRREHDEVHSFVLYCFVFHSK